MFFMSRKYLLVSFGLILALLGGLSGVTRVKASTNAIPQVNISTPSYPIGMDADESKLIPYSLTESSNTSGQITSRTYQFYTQYDVPLSEPMGPYPTNISVKSLETTDWNELVYLPKSVVEEARSIKEYAIVLKTTFTGESISKAEFNAEASVLILLPPAAFSKKIPANGAALQSTNPSLKWSSSVGAIDYEYCFDTVDNDSCDTDWTGTYWLGTYDTNAALRSLPSGTTFYWQVRANNMAGTTYANNGRWWFFTISAPTVLSITRVNENPTSATSVAFTVTFSEPVTDVDKSDFTLNVTESISGADIGNVSGSGATRTVTANTGSGNGSLRLDVPVNATIYDSVGNALGGLPFTDGEIYTIDKDPKPFTNCAAQTQIPAAECEALVALYNSTNGAGWTNDFGWLQTDTPCNWYGVTCGNGSNVTELYLISQHLVGTIPPELGNLTHLEQLGLSLNQLTGSIPPELGNLANLRELWLGYTLLTGDVPSQLGNLTNLTALELDDNQLTGAIPPQLGNLTNLGYLGLSDNQLTGSIPTELGSLTNLAHLDLGSNQLTGSIPPQLVSLTNLTVLELGSNQLTGSIPPELGNLTNLKYRLDLGSNQLTGSIPPELGNLTNLQDLWLDNNRLTGEFPTSIVKLTHLNSFHFDCWITSIDPTVIAFVDSISPGWQTNICPVVSTITRANGNPTSASSVDFTVTFSEPVVNVDKSDFTLNVTGSISGATIQNVSGSGATRTVTVNRGSGNGTLRLDVPVTATATDLVGNALGNLPFTSGEMYTINDEQYYMAVTRMGDFNGDGKAEVAVFRPSSSTWYINGVDTFLFGGPGDIPVVGDYNGDGKDDIAIFRPSTSTWYIKDVGAYLFGGPGDIPVVADYNGDRRADIAVFRPSNSTWYINGVGTYLFGGPGDIPVVADYNGDRKADIAVFRPSNSTWYINGVGTYLFGGPGDIPVVADYNGDSRADIAVFRPSNSIWYVAGVGSFLFGGPGDVPVVGDYNGDRKADIAVFRSSNSTWYIVGVGSFLFGGPGDIPV